jgi:hypothetical protein
VFIRVGYGNLTHQPKDANSFRRAGIFVQVELDPFFDLRLLTPHKGVRVADEGADEWI